MWGSHRKLCPIIRGSRTRMDRLWLCLSRKYAAPFSGLFPQIKTNQENIKFSDLHLLSAELLRHRPQEERSAAVNESCRHHGLITKHEELTFTVKVRLWFLITFSWCICCRTNFRRSKLTEVSLRSVVIISYTLPQHAGGWVTPVIECKFKLPQWHRGGWDPRGPIPGKALLLFQWNDRVCSELLLQTQRCCVVFSQDFFRGRVMTSRE